MSAHKVYLDSCLLIYLLEGEPALQAMARQKFRQLFNSSSELWMSELSRLECRVKPIKHRQQSLLDQYDRFFKLPDIRIAELSVQVLERATLIRAHTGLKTPDAIHGAIALEYGCDLLLSNDLKFKQLEPDIQVELLSRV